MSPLKTEITALMAERYVNPTPFETFASQLLGLGITRLTFDAIKNEMSFYTKDQFIHSLIRTDLIEAQKSKPWAPGENLEISRLENAIKQLDAGEMPSIEFHREMLAAGTVFCKIYLVPRRIYYMGQDGNYYLENY
jgi:uncharacterized protein YbcV (DUF1398 family)